MTLTSQCAVWNYVHVKATLLRAHAVEPGALAGENLDNSGGSGDYAANWSTGAAVEDGRGGTLLHFRGKGA